MSQELIYGYITKNPYLLCLLFIIFLSPVECNSQEVFVLFIDVSQIGCVVGAQWVNAEHWKLDYSLFSLHPLDVYSFQEEEPVLDPHLAKHLAHFGIDMLHMHGVRMSTLSSLFPSRGEGTVCFFNILLLQYESSFFRL